MNLMIEKMNRNSADLSNEKGRTIYISYGEISGRIRKMSSEEKKLLHDNGVAAATQFFNSATAAHSNIVLCLSPAQKLPLPKTYTVCHFLTNFFIFYNYEYATFIRTGNYQER